VYSKEDKNGVQNGLGSRFQVGCKMHKLLK
jgi:hypothetical protein